MVAMPGSSFAYLAWFAVYLFVGGGGKTLEKEKGRTTGPAFSHTATPRTTKVQQQRNEITVRRVPSQSPVVVTPAKSVARTEGFRTPEKSLQMSLDAVGERFSIKLTIQPVFRVKQGGVTDG